MDLLVAIYTTGWLLVQYLIGFALIARLARLRFVQDDSGAEYSPRGADLPALWVLGLLLHLSLVLVAKSLGLSWWLASTIPVLVFAPLLREMRDGAAQLRRYVIALASPQFLLWTAVHLFLGYSLFSLTDGISTPWVNNYGDLTFHLGMISNFRHEGSFPPEYHLYAGESLSYPFFINLWTTILLVPFESYAAVRAVFAMQWIALWGVIYALLSPGRRYGLSWVLLFGGGSIVAVATRPDQFSWNLIDTGFPWTTWLSTVWVTQRSALLGVVMALAALTFVITKSEAARRPTWSLVAAGLVLGLAPLAHTHFFVVTAVFLGLYCVWPFVLRLRDSSGVVFASEEFRRFLALLLPALIALAFFPLLLGKTGMVEPMAGWSVATDGSIISSLRMWLLNAAPWFMAWGVLWWLTKAHVLWGSLAILFLIGNVVLMAQWQWDQLKYFIAVFTIFVFLWAIRLPATRAKGAVAALPYVLAVALTMPGIVEAMRVYAAGENYQVYSVEKLVLAAQIRYLTGRGQVIAAAPEHNSAATLSGRTIFFGYPGTLSSHSIAYGPREVLHREISRLVLCPALLKEQADSCPTVVVMDEAGQAYWGKYAASSLKAVHESSHGTIRLLYTAR